MEYSNEIPSVELGPNDVLVAHVGVGNMPPSRVLDYLATAKENLKAVFGDQPSIMLAVPEVRHTSFSVIHRPDLAREDRKVFHVDIGGGMSQEEIRDHLDRIRGSIRAAK